MSANRVGSIVSWIILLALVGFVLVKWAASWVILAELAKLIF